MHWCGRDLRVDYLLFVGVDVHEKLQHFAQVMKAFASLMFFVILPNSQPTLGSSQDAWEKSWVPMDRHQAYP